MTGGSYVDERWTKRGLKVEERWTKGGGNDGFGGSGRAEMYKLSSIVIKSAKTGKYAGCDDWIGECCDELEYDHL